MSTQFTVALMTMELTTFTESWRFGSFGRRFRRWFQKRRTIQVIDAFSEYNFDFILQLLHNLGQLKKPSKDYFKLRSNTS